MKLFSHFQHMKIYKFKMLNHFTLPFKELFCYNLLSILDPINLSIYFYF